MPDCLEGAWNYISGSLRESWELLVYINQLNPSNTSDHVPQSQLEKSQCWNQRSDKFCFLIPTASCTSTLNQHPHQEQHGFYGWDSVLQSTHEQKSTKDHRWHHVASVHLPLLHWQFWHHQGHTTEWPDLHGELDLLPALCLVGGQVLKAYFYLYEVRTITFIFIKNILIFKICIILQHL